MQSSSKFFLSVSIFSTLALATACPEEGVCENTFDCEIGAFCDDGRCSVAPDLVNATIRAFDGVPSTVVAGGTVSLQWTTADADTCEIFYDDVTLSVPCNGTRDVVVERTTEYALVATASGGDVRRVARVTTFEDVDGGSDAGADAGVDGGLAGADGGLDAGLDGGVDGGLDAGLDGGSDAGVDGGSDAGVDGGLDGGFDAGVVDAGPPAISVVTKAGSNGCVLFENGRIKCWGWNFYGQLGLGDTNDRGDEPNEMGSNLPYVDLDALATDVSCGDGHCCAILDDKSVKCWGLAGSLGYGDTLARGDGPGEMGANLPRVALNGEARKILVDGFSCALMVDDTLKCWGAGGDGQLGIESTESIGDNQGEMGSALVAVNLPGPVLDFSVGQTHACARVATGTYCWGSNFTGELGVGHTTNLGGSVGEMASLTALDVGFPIAEVVARDLGTCALSTNGGVKCFGGNFNGTLGLGDNEFRGDDPGEMGVNLAFVELPGTAVSLSLGDVTSFVVTQEGFALGWGANQGGELGIPGGNRGDEPDEMGANLPAIPFTFLVDKVFAGTYSSCATPRDDDTKLYCWGRGDSGALGTGNTDNVGGALGDIQALQPVPFF